MGNEYVVYDLHDINEIRYRVHKMRESGREVLYNVNQWSTWTLEVLPKMEA